MPHGAPRSLTSSGGLMLLTIEAYYDFRSPYAYFANHRIREGLFAPPAAVKWLWRPVSIDVLLNLQAGRDAWAVYSDPLSGPKRAHLLADVRRNAAFYNVPLRPPKPLRPNSIPALCAAALLGPESHDDFRNAVFDALWQQQRDISDSSVLAECMMNAGADPDLVSRALTSGAREALAEDTKLAYANGIFGVPTFVCNNEIFFGNDRLDMLGWRLGHENPRA
jgi:2-hydroxychromene-2-carboxylate isomerase